MSCDRLSQTPDAFVACFCAAYRGSRAVLKQHLSEYKAKSTDLYDTYKRWCEGNGEHADLSQRAFGSALLAKGYERYTSNGTWYRGLGLPVQEGEREA